MHRILLESMLYAENSFVTVTYGDVHLPVVSGVPTLKREDYRNWLKRLRERMRGVIPDWRLRFFLVGEYGDKELRPHYHAMLFGYKGCAYGDWFVYSGQNIRECVCQSCQFIRESWGKGRIHQGIVEHKSAQYVAGYTVKCVTDKDDGRLEGREPEFARMSLRPGIGYGSVGRIKETLRRYASFDGKDVPSMLRLGAKLLPVGRYLVGKLREELSISDEVKGQTLEKWREELRALREAAEALSDKKVYVAGTYNDEIFKALLVEQDAEKVRQIEARRNLYERGKK